ncbi:MAG: hypothetical protein JRI41_09530 [Deltaproteobacteria bacterium]|nr:hypothetical protein [Deltaproteobacteria bacterium]
MQRQERLPSGKVVAFRMPDQHSLSIGRSIVGLTLCVKGRESPLCVVFGESCV